MRAGITSVAEIGLDFHQSPDESLAVGQRPHEQGTNQIRRNRQGGALEEGARQNRAQPHEDNTTGGPCQMATPAVISGGTPSTRLHPALQKALADLERAD
jgi:hypothetical protein